MSKKSELKNTRESKIVRTSIISILSNLLLVAFKAGVGFAANSVAIISDAINNLSDALSSIITIIGTKLAGKPADKKHPYGYGRIEHIASLIVSAIVLYAGITAFVESVEKIITPETADYNVFTVVILIAGILVKIVLGIFVKKQGEKVKSDALSASGTDALNDAILSISVLASVVIYMLFGVSLEAFAGIIVSVFIMKSGFELIRESVDHMIGTRVESKLAKQIKKEIAKEPGVRGAFDLVLNDYGPNKYLGSVHIEVPDTLTVSELDQISRRISRNVAKKYDVILHTVGIYSINTKDKDALEAEKEVRGVVFSHDGILGLHGFYINREEKILNFDIIIDFKVKNREEVYREIYDEIKDKFKDYKINITLDIDVSD